ncbi:MAG TPA: hypothetical protein VF192_12775 [Longimicrobiales bacterium]
MFIPREVFDYLDTRGRLVWALYPETRTVAVHRTRAEARFLTETDVLDGGEVLPGFRLEVARLFAS